MCLPIWVDTIQVGRHSAPYIKLLVEAFVVDHRPSLDASTLTFAILGGAVALKFGLYFFCVSMRGHSATMLALAEDHLNDIMRSVHVATSLSALAASHDLGHCLCLNCISTVDPIQIYSVSNSRPVTELCFDSDAVPAKTMRQALHSLKLQVASTMHLPYLQLHQ